LYWAPINLYGNVTNNEVAVLLTANYAEVRRRYGPRARHYGIKVRRARVDVERAQPRDHDGLAFQLLTSL
jgi:hypothetical protein